jgi:hypothetical protein
VSASLTFSPDTAPLPNLTVLAIYCACGRWAIASSYVIHALISRGFLDAHDAEMAVVAANAEPELDRGRFGCHCRVAKGMKRSMVRLRPISKGRANEEI